MLLERRLAVRGSVVAGRQLAGTIVGYAGNGAPDGWLICDGAEVPRLQYAALFNVIGVNYGDGDGIETFNVPDLHELQTDPVVNYLIATGA